MRIILKNDFINASDEIGYEKECFYFEIIDDENSAISSDLAVAELFGLNEKEYTQRLIKAFNRSYTFDGGELYLTFDNLVNLSEEELIDKFKEEFLIELTTKSLV